MDAQDGSGRDDVDQMERRHTPLASEAWHRYSQDVNLGDLLLLSDAHANTAIGAAEYRAELSL